MAKNGDGDSKVERLSKQGGLNRKAQEVRDELFLKHDFFDSRDLLQVKYEMVRRVKKDGWTVTQASNIFGFSRPSFYKAQKAFDQEGLAGLIPHQRGPKAAYKLSGEVLEFVERVLKEDRTLRSPDLVSLIEKRFGLKVHPRSIERALARRGKK